MGTLAKVPMPLGGINMGPNKRVIKDLDTDGTPVYTDVTVLAGGDPTSAVQDAFGRLRVSAPATIFESTMEYTAHDLLWDTYSSGLVSSGLSTAGYLDLSVTGAGRLVRQTFQYHRYQPGKSQLIFMTGVLGSGISGVTKRIGYYDDSEGLFFEQAEDGLYVVRRTGGSDTRVHQDLWNINKMGSSTEHPVDTTKAQIFVIDFEWLGVGSVRFGVVHDGLLFYVHQFVHANIVTQPYMATGNLPVRYCIVSTGAPATLRQICASVISEGGYDQNLNIASTAITPAAGISASQNVWTNIIAVRPKVIFGNKANRAYASLGSISIGASGASAMVRVVYGEIPVASGIWTSTGPHSSLEYITGTIGITELLPVGSTHVFVAGTGVNARNDSPITPAKFQLPLAWDIYQTKARIIVLQAQGMGGAATVNAALNFQEVY